jgi:A/G-specific adenine glycosylase
VIRKSLKSKRTYSAQVNAKEARSKRLISKRTNVAQTNSKTNHSKLIKLQRVNPQKFTQYVLAWFQQHGRKNLPWQHKISPYRVWVSEIMLQQTQVQTVIPYFKRFMQRFLRIADLANAAEDEVLHLWTGLGYYARARHLHKTAKIIQQQFKGKFPRDLATLQTLPGIGRSTAGAILAIAMHQPAAILDGNVKRVLSRVHAIAGWPGQPEVAAQLWQYAEQYTPQQLTAEYTQAMMDIGALICTRTKPQCTICPLQKICLAHQANNETAYPSKKPAKKLPIRALQALIFYMKIVKCY